MRCRRLVRMVKQLDYVNALLRLNIILFAPSLTPHFGYYSLDQMRLNVLFTI